MTNNVYNPACQHLSNGTYFTVTYSNNENMPELGSIATYSCIEGYYTLNSTTRYCNMTWNSTEPECEPVSCLPPHLPANGSYVSEKTTHHYGDIIDFSCLPGFKLIGEDSSFCNSTGQWSKESPSCQIKDCGNLTDPINGTVSHSDGTSFNQSAYYNCSEGYRLNGTDTRTCNVSGNWTFEAPTCDVIRKCYLYYVRKYVYM